MDDLRITKKSLGRSAKLGDLYSATTDTFMNDSMFSTSIPETTITNSYTKFEFINFNRFDEKIKICDVDAELAVSIMCGMTSVSGQGEYILENGNHNGETEISLFCNVVKQTKEFDPFNDALKPFISIDTLMNCKEATHVVVGIDMGVNAVVSLKYSKLKDEDSMGTSAELMAQLQRVVSSISIDDTGSGSKLDDPPQKNSSSCNYNLRFYSDIFDINEESPATIDEAIARLQSIITKVNGDMAKACNFILLPLTCFVDYLEVVQLCDRVVQRIDNDLLDAILRIFNEITSKKMQLNDLRAIVDKYVDYVSVDEKQTILLNIKELEDKEIEIKQELAECIKDVRSKRKTEIELSVIVERISVSCLTGSLDTFFVDAQSIVQKINFINDAISKGVRYVEHFEDIPLTGECYIFFYDGAHEQLSKKKLLFDKLVETHSVSCYFADLNVRPNISKMRDIPNGTRICRFVNGNCLNLDVLHPYGDKHIFCYIKCNSKMKVVTGKPIEKMQLKLVCPNSIGKDKCNKEKHLWFCKNCQSPIEYGFDGMFYCKCGSQNSNNFEFHCNDFMHGDDYVKFTNQLLDQYLKEIHSMPQLNILVLGETGVGKSTWINGIANYLTYKTLKEASDAKEVLCLIPTKFTLLEDFQEKVVAIGSSENECNEDGQACTQHPMAYLFDVNDCLIRIIDTPGIGDPRGVEQDKENLENVIRFASNFNDIHGICILLKPNNAKLHTYFRFCILEMLTHLNKSAINNIMFCFTNTRSTFYKPGDTYPALKKLLDGINESLQSKSLGNVRQPELILSEDTMYCMDNESFRFLCARRCGVDFSDDDFKNFALSWTRSVNETNRMLNHIKRVKPHKTVETIKMNEARQKILLLAKSMAKISDNIAKNLRVAKQQKAYTKTLKQEEMMLLRNRHFTQIAISTEKVTKPQTVCTSRQCIELRTIPGTKEKKIIYKTTCHPDCELEGIYEDVVGAEGLRKCWAMDSGESLNCKICECPWSKHMHITYKFKEESVQVVDETIEKLILEKSKDRKLKLKMIGALVEKIQNFKAEQEQILEISTKFGSFLRNHAILPYNDAFEAHVRHELDLATADSQLSGDNTKVVTLKSLLEQYAEKKKFLDNVMVNSVGEITFEDIDQLKNQLMEMPLTGTECFETARMAMYNGNTTGGVNMAQTSLAQALVMINNPNMIMHNASNLAAFQMSATTSNATFTLLERVKTSLTNLFRR